MFYCVSSFKLLCK